MKPRERSGIGAAMTNLLYDATSPMAEYDARGQHAAALAAGVGGAYAFPARGARRPTNMRPVNLLGTKNPMLRNLPARVLFRTLMAAERMNRRHSLLGN